MFSNEYQNINYKLRINNNIVFFIVNLINIISLLFVHSSYFINY